MKITRLTLLLHLSLVVPLFAVAGAGHGSLDDIEALVQPFIEQGWIHGCVVGILHGDSERVMGFGGRSAEDGRAPTGNTPYAIGSISKTFTALLLCQQAARQDDPAAFRTLPLASFFPEAVFPGDQGEITLGHLAQHLSGLPKMPDNLVSVDPLDPYAGYTVDRMLAFMEGHTLSRPPGERYGYSNLGAALLGQALARRSGRAYGDLLEEEILGPLALDATGIHPLEPSEEELVPGHDEDLVPVPYWTFGPFDPAGGIRSTANDMLRYLHHHLNPESSPLGPAIEMALEEKHRVTDSLAIARGWHYLPEIDVFFHDGGTGGFRSLTAFSPSRDRGVVFLANATGFPLNFSIQDASSSLPRAILDRAMGLDSVPLTPRMRRSLPADAGEIYSGHYVFEHDPSFEAEVSVVDGHLQAVFTGGFIYDLHLLDGEEFYERLLDLRFRFEREAGTDPALAFTWYQGRETLRLVRKSP